MGRTRIAALLGFGLFASVLAGCATSPEPGVTAQWGRLETTVQAQPEEVAEASREVFRDMELFVISSQATRLNGQVIARSAQDKRVTVDLQNVGEGTKISLRGAGGWPLQEKGLGLELLRRIKQNVEGGQQPEAGEQGAEADAQTPEQAEGQQAEASEAQAKAESNADKASEDADGSKAEPTRFEESNPEAEPAAAQAG
jgi:hypothetical protein